jgi:hypothetical protein
MRPSASPTERFTAWYAKSIEKLKELPEGDGAFAALMIALPLYERYIIAKLKLDGNPTGDEDVRREISNDLKLDDRHRSIFWGMVRTGFMHQAMVTAGATKWLVECVKQTISYRVAHELSSLSRGYRSLWRSR